MDLIILLVLVAVIVFFFKDFKSVVYFIGIIEIFFHLIHFIGDKLGIIAINQFINDYIPSTILEILARYSAGLLYDIFEWLFVFLFIAFLFYLIKYFIKK